MTDINPTLEEELATKIVRACTAYDRGKPIMSDKSFDDLVNKLHSVNPNNKIFGKPFGGEHLLSLDNTRFTEWYRGKRKNTPLVIEPKIDGVALGISYQNGKLFRAYTRSGRDVTRYAKQVADIPLEVPRTGRFIVRGELYAYNEFTPKSQRVAAAQLRKVKPDCHLLSFIGFEIINSQNDHIDNLKTLKEYSFNVVPFIVVNTADEVIKYHNDWLDGRFMNRYPTDGIVAKVNSRKIQKELGQSNKCPLWALALKR